MLRDDFFEIYRRLGSAATDFPAAAAAEDELSAAFLEHERAGGGSEWLASADDCIYEIAESPPLFSRAISSWITSTGFAELIKAVLHQANVRHLRPTSAVAYDLSGVDEARAILTGCRLCAINVVPAISLGWTLSLLAARPTSEASLRAAEFLLLYHTDEFPWSTEKMLEVYGAGNDLPLVAAALKYLRRLSASLEALPRLRELEMPLEARLALAQLRQSENREIQRKAAKASVFAGMISEHHFKYATQVAIEVPVGDGLRDSSLQMAGMSLSIELPFSEHTDPLAGAARRRSMWQGVPA